MDYANATYIVNFENGFELSAPNYGSAVNAANLGRGVVSVDVVIDSKRHQVAKHDGKRIVWFNFPPKCDTPNPVKMKLVSADLFYGDRHCDMKYHFNRDKSDDPVFVTIDVHSDDAVCKLVDRVLPVLSRASGGHQLHQPTSVDVTPWGVVIVGDGYSAHFVNNELLKQFSCPESFALRSRTVAYTPGDDVRGVRRSQTA